MKSVGGFLDLAADSTVTANEIAVLKGVYAANQGDRPLNAKRHPPDILEVTVLEVEMKMVHMRHGDMAALRFRLLTVGRPLLDQVARAVL